MYSCFHIKEPNFLLYNAKTQKFKLKIGPCHHLIIVKKIKQLINNSQIFNKIIFDKEI